MGARVLLNAEEIANGVLRLGAHVHDEHPAAAQFRKEGPMMRMAKLLHTAKLDGCMIGCTSSLGKLSTSRGRLSAPTAGCIELSTSDAMVFMNMRGSTSTSG